MVFAIKIGAAFSYKLKRGLAGRRQSNAIVQHHFQPTDQVIWMHAASLGEYEQGLPVLEKLKSHLPQHKILITFFSPSGYENVVKKNTVADAICYLPFDLNNAVVDFTSHFQTEIFITVKYEYWYNLLSHLKSRNVKIYVISALFYEKQSFFQLYGKWFTEKLKNTVTRFFHQSNQSYALAKTIRLDQSTIAGDTRFDRVKQIRQRDNQVEFIGAFKNGKKLMVIGSSWEAEEKIAANIAARNKTWKIIIAPHDLKRVHHLTEQFPHAVLYSRLVDGGTLRTDAQVMIIDCIGLLSKIYSYGDAAIVGGGFHDKGLHNILEAAVYGIPVFFGNHYTKNPEADGIVSVFGGKSFEDEYLAAEYLLTILPDEQKLQEMGENAENFVESQPDATEIIVRGILSDLQNVPVS